jgi:heterodisulfide reductase subunit C
MVLHVKYNQKNTIGDIKKAAEICLQCGVCCVVKGQSCHAQYDPQFTPKNTYVYDCLNHDTPEKNPNIWLCVSCHKCEDLCPYDVSPLKFIDAMKEKAYQKGLAPALMTGEIKQVLETGYAFPVTANTIRLRELLELQHIESDIANELELLISKIHYQTSEERVE